VVYRVFQIGGINLKVNPMLQNAGDLLQCVNMEDDMIGAKKKRPGYNTYLASLGLPIDSLFSWRTNVGTQFWNYASAGGSLFYSKQGTGAWTVCGDGTITAGERVGCADIQGTLLAVGDGVTDTRYSTNGTSFTTLAGCPASNQLINYHDRLYALGTIAAHFATGGTPTDWTTDSSSIDIPGGGAPRCMFKVADRAIMTKDTCNMFRWDDYSLTDLATDMGPSSPVSIGNIEDYKIYLTRLGYVGYGGSSPQLISNPIEKQIYNDVGSGIQGTVFDTAPGVCYRYDYLCAVGTVTDDLTGETINNCIHKYNFQQDEWSNWNFANLPTAFGTYLDQNSNKQLIFGDATGQCYTYGGTNTSDNGVAISAAMAGVLHFDAPEIDKQFNYINVFANPGCEADFQVAIGDTFTNASKNWVSIGDFHDGVAEFRFPGGSEGKLLFWKVIESSTDARFQQFGFTVNYDLITTRG